MVGVTVEKTEYFAKCNGYPLKKMDSSHPTANSLDYRMLHNEPFKSVSLIMNNQHTKYTSRKYIAERTTKCILCHITTSHSRVKRSPLAAPLKCVVAECPLACFHSVVACMLCNVPPNVSLLFREFR